MSFLIAMGILSQSQEIDEQRQAARKRRKMDPFYYLSRNEFIRTYRLTKHQTRRLICQAESCIPKEKRIDGLSVQTKVLIALAFYAKGSYQSLVGQWYHGVSQSSVSRAIQQVTKFLNTREIFDEYVKFPISREARDNIKRCFYKKFKIPGVVGCIDGTHVAIIRPRHHEERYFNTKGYHSLNVMVICDADLNILCVDPSKPGATHDSVVWQSHPLQPYLHQKYNEEEIFLLGDSGYPLQKSIMTPVLNAVAGSPEEHYNKLQVSARNTVERCIGILKARFRCLSSARILHYDPVFAGKIVNACTVLHNIANKARLPVPRMSNEDREQGDRMRIQRRVTEQDVHADSLIIHAKDDGRGDRDLLEGRAVQQALINRLWLDR